MNATVFARFNLHVTRAERLAVLVKYARAREYLPGAEIGITRPVFRVRAGDCWTTAVVICPIKARDLVVVRPCRTLFAFGRADAVPRSAARGGAGRRRLRAIANASRARPQPLVGALGIHRLEAESGRCVAASASFGRGEAIVADRTSPEPFPAVHFALKLSRYLAVRRPCAARAGRRRGAGFRVASGSSLFRYALAPYAYVVDHGLAASSLAV